MYGSIMYPNDKKTSPVQMTCFAYSHPPPSPARFSSRSTEFASLVCSHLVFLLLSLDGECDTPARRGVAQAMECMVLLLGNIDRLRLVQQTSLKRQSYTFDFLWKQSLHVIFFPKTNKVEAKHRRKCVLISFRAMRKTHFDKANVINGLYRREGAGKCPNQTHTSIVSEIWLKRIYLCSLTICRQNTVTLTTLW